MSEIKNILITGGTGLVGRRLSALLVKQGHHVKHLSRNPAKSSFDAYHWDPARGEVEAESVSWASVIVHLAGAGVADHRWTSSWKKEIYDSRVHATKMLREAVVAHNPDLSHFVSASAIGYYGWNTGDQWVDEKSEKGEDFLADVVADWEEEVKGFGQAGIKHAMVRVGIVLAEEGGALEKMKQPVKLGVGAALGSGRQFMSWIHIDDLCRMFAHVISGKLQGICNGVSPEPVTNRVFTRQLAEKLRKPLFLPNVPSFVLKLMLGEMSAMLTGGNRVSAEKVGTSGFDFHFSSLDSALQDLIK